MPKLEIVKPCNLINAPRVILKIPRSEFGDDIGIPHIGAETNAKSR